MQQDAQTKAEMSKYDDQLARARAADEHEKYRQRNAELVRMQEDSAARQEQQKQVVAQQIEAERRATDTHKVGTTWLSLCQAVAGLAPLLTTF